MLFGTSQAAVVAVQFTASKIGKTGLNAGLTVKVYDVTGAAQVGSGNISSAEIDSTNQPGVYRVTVAGAGNASTGAYIVNVHTADTSVDQQDLGAIYYCYPWVNYIDAAISSRAIPSVALAVTAGGTPVVGDFVTEQGTDCKAADGTAIQWGPLALGYSLAGATLQFTGPFTATVTASPSGANWNLSLDLTAAQNSLAAGQYPFRIVATLANGDKEVPIKGMWTVQKSA